MTMLCTTISTPAWGIQVVLFIIVSNSVSIVLESMIQGPIIQGLDPFSEVPFFLGSLERLTEEVCQVAFQSRFFIFIFRNGPSM